ncbi:MAG: S-layer homology domain-containing protein [Clostridia bacterium]|nr:S-layer homology domain-containing protein [Clostridia bacterium]
MKKIISIICAIIMSVSTLTAFAATEYEVREEMSMSYGPGVYVSESTALKEICAKTGYNDFEYGYIVAYGGGYGGGGADASLPIDDTKGCTKLVFDARIINDDFCTVEEMSRIMYPDEEEYGLAGVYPEETTCTVSVQCHWEDEYSEEIDYPWIDITSEWKHYEVDITNFDRCRVYIDPLGASAERNELCAAIVANLKLVKEDTVGGDVTVTEPETEEEELSIPGVYGDAPSEWAREEISKANKAGLLGDWLTGYTTPIIRAEFAELMSATVLKAIGKTQEEYLAGFEADKLVSPFKDINSEAVTIAYLMGITDGVGDDLFAPNKNITRQEIAVMMCRAITLVQSLKDTQYVELSDDLSAFSDESLVSDWAIEGVATLAKKGIMNGTSDTTLSPLDNTTVEQAIALAVRIYEIIK